MRITDITDAEKRFIQYFRDHSIEDNKPFNDVIVEENEIISYLSITLDELDEIIEVMQDNQIIDSDFELCRNKPIQMNYSVFLKYDYLYQEYHIDEIVPKVINFLNESITDNDGYIFASKLQDTLKLTNEETNIILCYLEENNIFKQKLPMYGHYLDCDFIIDKRALKKL